jgi:hypothetical protein
MPVAFSESGFRIDFPGQGFRLQDCAAYNANKHAALKEVDVVLFNALGNQLLFVELKQLWDANNHLFQTTNLGSDSLAEEWAQKIATKIIHSVAMLTSNRMGIETCHTMPLDPNTHFDALVLLFCQPSQVGYLSSLQHRIRSYTAPYEKIYRIRSLNVLDQTLAKKNFSWVS